MDALLRDHGCRDGVFITAWNPLSRRMPPGWNRRRQIALAERLRRVKVVAGQGRWRGWREAHLLVLAHPERVRRLARLFRQYAVVQVRIGQTVRLIRTSGCGNRTACCVPQPTRQIERTRCSGDTGQGGAAALVNRIRTGSPHFGRAMLNPRHARPRHDL